ncbi:MAG: hypothetical protein JKX81_17755 [Arenicella sp.]|nr:hypothetical protein [Arenicella sp.]
MNNYMLVRAFGVIALCCLFTITASAQTVAILDQGHNTTLSHKGKSKFVTQHCFSYPDQSILSPNTPSDPADGIILSIFYASLCVSGAQQQYNSFNAAAHPRTFFEPITGTTYTTSRKLTHARNMSDSIWDFNRGVFHQHFQVLGMAGNQKDGTIRGLDVVVADNSVKSSSYKTRSGQNIINALNVLSFNFTPDLGAVTISTVVGNLNSTPDICRPSSFGQEIVDRLRSKGIAVVAGLANRTIPAGVRTWPNCLKGVINVGRTDGFDSKLNGNGVGANGIDFYAKGAVTNSSGTEIGNSFAGPKVAAAFALLHKAHPNSTVDQKIQALQEANTKMFTRDGETRRLIMKSHIQDAIAKLTNIISNDNNNNNPNDDIHFDPTSYGVAFGGEASDKIEVDLDFDALSFAALATNQSTIKSNILEPIVLNSSIPDGRRDVVLRFTGLFDGAISSHRRFRFILNNFQHDILDGFPDNEETTKSYVINRNLFGSPQFRNRIELAPFFLDSIWGIKDVSIKFLPTIRLTVGAMDTNQYGYLETPSRYTGARFKFDLPARDKDYKLTMTGWDIDRSDETEVLFNGTSIGFLRAGSSNNSYSTKNTFTLSKSLLSVGANVIELRQRYPDSAWSGLEAEKWAVKDILVESKKTFMSPIIMLIMHD